MNLRRIAGVEFVVAYIESKSGISLPSGPTIIRSEDRLGILTKSENIPHFLKLSGSKLADIKKISYKNTKSKNIPSKILYIAKMANEAFFNHLIKNHTANKPKIPAEIIP